MARPILDDAVIEAHFDQCYTVIVAALESNRDDLALHYTRWVYDHLPLKFAFWLEWARDNGWPTLVAVRRWGPR